MIYLRPEAGPNSIGDDTFWTWFSRMFPSSFDVPTSLASGDILLQYGVLGAPREKGGMTVALLWELYPEMRKQLGDETNAGKIDRMYDAYENCDMAMVSCESMLEFFPNAEVMAIGVDTDLFAPVDPTEGRRTGTIWCGTDHPMKGRDLADQWALTSGADIRFIEKGQMDQKSLASVMRRSEYVLLSSRLRPLYLVEWEALAAGCKPIDISTVERDPPPSGDPRKFVHDHGWSRHQVERGWRIFLGLQ